MIKRLFLFSALICLTFSLIAGGTHSLMITEMMAVNGNTLQDEDGDYPDWIEIHNPSSEAVNLSGWSLTDDWSEPGKWIFPATIIDAGAYIVVFASDKNRKNTPGTLHTNFKLSGSGEYLALNEPGGQVAFDYEEMFPAQQKDVSYGWLNGMNVFFTSPTPGQANSASDQALDPVFSKTRGFYSAPFKVELSAAQSGVAIYFTTDGSIPTAATASLYSQPIDITTTSVVSAIAVSENDTSSVVTHSYLFAADIALQAAQHEGYPNEWSRYVYQDRRAPADYEMDPEVVTNPSYSELIDDALMAVPSLCLISNSSNFFSHEANHEQGGIYIFTGKSGDGSMGIDWERPASVEYIDPSTGQNFQLNCALKLHGGNSRVPDNSQKHSFRITFRESHGPSKLNFNLFDDTRKPTNEFNALVLRAGYNYSWTKNSKAQNVKADFLRDPFSKNTQLDMGHHSAHNRFVHLYINGLYWGLYNLSEKINDDFMASYMNGDEDDWDVVKDHNGTVDGSRNDWNTLLSLSSNTLSSNSAYMKLLGKNPDGTDNPAYPKYVDAKNLIDYILLNFYIGNKDWDGNNWLAARNKVNTKNGFRMFVWDAETSMINPQENIVKMNDGEPTRLFNNLLTNDNFRVLLADRIHKHFFNGGALTPEATSERYSELINEIDFAIIAESARWGDYRRDVHNIGDGAELYTRNDHWLPEVENQLNSYYPARTQTVFKQLKNAGFYPSLNAPLFSHYEAKVESPLEFTMENPNASGELYYTTDDSDPRNTDGGLSASALPYHGPITIGAKGTIRARVKSGTTWSAISKAEFRSDLNGDFVTSDDELQLVSASCYPNPVSERATISYYLPNNSMVNAAIYSLDGRLVKQLYKGNQQSGNQHLYWNPETQKNGVYFYNIMVDGRRFSGKIVLAR
jgi:hypothetical protein